MGTYARLHQGKTLLVPGLTGATLAPGKCAASQQKDAATYWVSSQRQVGFPTRGIFAIQLRTEDPQVGGTTCDIQIRLVHGGDDNGGSPDDNVLIGGLLPTIDLTDYNSLANTRLLDTFSMPTGAGAYFRKHIEVTDLPRHWALAIASPASNDFDLHSDLSTASHLFYFTPTHFSRVP